MVINTDLLERRRKPIRNLKVEYNIYNILYVDKCKNNALAVAAAESEEEAIGFLEQSIKDAGYVTLSEGELNAVTEITKFKTYEKGLIGGYDASSRRII
jgi:hypothetical protein